MLKGRLDTTTLVFIVVTVLVLAVAGLSMSLWGSLSLEGETSSTPCTIAVEFVNKEYASHLQEGVLKLPLERIKVLNELIASACEGGE